MKRRRQESSSSESSGSRSPVRIEADAQRVPYYNSANKIGAQIDQQNVRGSITNTYHFYNESVAESLERGSEIVSTVDKREIANYRKRCLESLDFPQSNTRYLSIRNALHATCKWLTEKTQYQDWLNDKSFPVHRGFFWLKGKPGTGKSTMMKFLSASEKQHPAGKIIVTFFFHARGTELEKSTLGLYRSVLFQLLKKVPALVHTLNSIEAIPIFSNGLEWNIEILKKLISQSVQQLGDKSLVLLVDALDECGDDEVLDMVRFFEDLGELAEISNIRFRICLSSRHYPHITIRYGHSMVLEHQDEHQQDIRQFIDSELRVDNSQKASTIKSKILEKSSGIFLWVFLVIPMLNRAYSRGRIHELEKLLDQIPDKLESLFKEILSKEFVQEQDIHSQDELEICVYWVLYAQRPLTTVELYFAINFSIQKDFFAQWDDENIDEEDMARFVLDCSRGFLENARDKYGTIQFIHESVREFFLRHTSPQDAEHTNERTIALVQERLMKCCQRYFQKASTECALDSAHDLPKAKSLEAVSLREGLGGIFPFIEYAVKYCLVHGNIAQALGRSQVEFLRNFSLRAWLSFWNVFEIHEIRRYPNTISLLYILANECLSNLLEQWISMIDTIDIYGGRWGHPLVAAMMSSKISSKAQTLECFLIADQSAFNNDSSYKTQLMPNESDRQEAMNFLNYRASIVDYVPGESVFSFALKTSKLSLAKCLLATGKVDVDAKIRGESVLLVSIEREYMAVAEYLLQHGATYSGLEVNWLLTVFSLKGSSASVLKILANKFSIELKPEYLVRALSAASIGDHPDIMDLLIAYGADCNTENLSFPSPLLAALIFGHPHIVRKLLDSGSRIDLPLALIAAMTDWNDHFARNMLESENYWFHMNVFHLQKQKTPHLVNILVEMIWDPTTGTEGTSMQNLSSADAYEWLASDFLKSPLTVAASKGYIDVTKRLLPVKARFPATDHTKDMPLLTATTAGQSELVVELIKEDDLGGDLLDTNVYKTTLNNALELALENGQWSVISVLLRAGADHQILANLFHDTIRSVSRSLDYVQGISAGSHRLYLSRDHQATVYYGQLQLLKMLLKAGSNPNRKIFIDNSNYLSEPSIQPVSFLSQTRKPNGFPSEFTTLLLKYGADPEPWIYEYLTHEQVEALRMTRKQDSDPPNDPKDG